MNREKKKILNKTLVVFTLIALAATVLSGCTETNDDDDAGLSIVVVGRDSASGTREFFYEHVMDKEDFTDNMLEKNSNGAVHQTISQTKGAIGYVGLGYIDNNIKALKVNGIEPTVANVMSQTYPIARNLNMMTDGEPTGIALEFLNFIDSDDGQAIVEEEGFVPKQSSGPYTTVEGLSGSITIIGSTTVLPITSLAGEAFEALYPEVTIAVSGGGSSVGVTSAGEGTADIGMASREIKSSEIDKYPTLVIHVVCSDGIAMIVHPDNDYVDDLTIQQVKDIYLGTYTNWNEL
ncbi:MAG: substrate-binding domain-containing protein [Candidatus Thermoplasmatota archaeon]|nr:substrate-binding domain-containing protein [Candidatus Thermoplasmatota archaeon]